jgi:hypothetical protein
MNEFLLISSRLYLCELRVLLFLPIHKVFKFDLSFILLYRQNIWHSVLPLQPGPRPSLYAIPVTLICVSVSRGSANGSDVCVFRNRSQTFTRLVLECVWLGTCLRYTRARQCIGREAEINSIRWAAAWDIYVNEKWKLMLISTGYLLKPRRRNKIVQEQPGTFSTVINNSTLQAPSVLL